MVPQVAVDLPVVTFCNSVIQYLTSNFDIGKTYSGSGDSFSSGRASASGATSFVDDEGAGCASATGSGSS